MKKLIAGNWKMNGSIESAIDLIDGIEKAITEQPALLEKCDFLVCPPALHMMAVQGSLENVSLGAQNCAATDNGAYTGEISAAMLADLGVSYVILGHSERREYFGESDADVNAKAAKAIENGLNVIICVGETEEQRDQGVQNDIVGAQLAASIPNNANADNMVIAYEPVWAIGTGKTATADDVAAMHGFIRDFLSSRHSGEGRERILYGGSMKPGNAAELLATPNVDGGLIGGASLKVDDFIGIGKAA